MRDRHEVEEVIVVDDYSSDFTGELASKMGARLISMEKNGGPGAARNRAAAGAIGNILWFVDADVVVHPGSASKISRVLEDREIFAVFGSYDDRPTAQNFASQYKNLVHRFYHQKGKSDASTFWAGCGAVRKDIFQELDGFDIERFKVPSIEDIELGYRLTGAGGRIRLIHDLQATHLKKWTLAGIVKTDIFCRAIPWARLMLGGGGITDDLNVGRGERGRAFIGGLFFLLLFTTLVRPALVWLPVLAFCLALIVNIELFRFFQKCRSTAFAFAAIAFHQFYYLYSGVVFAFCLLEAKLGGANGKATDESR